MVTLGQSVAALVERSQSTGRRQGVVTAIDATTGTLTARVGGADVQGIPWQASSYSPVVGDAVTIVWDRDYGMLVTGTLSTVRVSEPDPVDVVLGWKAGWIKQNYITYEGGTPAPPDNWAGLDVAGPMDQGLWQLSLTAEGMDYPAVYEAATALYWGDPAAAIPEGARFERMALWARAEVLGQYGDRDGGPPRSPRFFGHTYDSLPPGSIGNPPEVHPDFGPWEPAALVHGEEVLLPIRNDWAQALLDGTIAGLWVWSDREDQKLRLTTTDPEDDLYRAPRLIVTYTPPPEA